MTDKIQKGKKSVITWGIFILILTVICIIGAILCTVAAGTKWWLITLAIILYILGIFGLIVGITFVWTGCTIKAITANIKDNNIPLENGSINATFCPNCGATVNPGDKFCLVCAQPISNIKICKSCKAQNEKEATACTKCGKPL